MYYYNYWSTHIEGTVQNGLKVSGNPHPAQELSVRSVLVYYFMLVGEAHLKYLII